MKSRRCCGGLRLRLAALIVIKYMFHLHCRRLFMLETAVIRLLTVDRSIVSGHEKLI